MNKIIKYIETDIYKKVWKTREDVQTNLKEFTSLIFTEVFNICWKHCDNDTLGLIMDEIDKIKEENELPI